MISMFVIAYHEVNQNVKIVLPLTFNLWEPMVGKGGNVLSMWTTLQHG